ncbi:MAG: chloride channel protein [Acidobacteria bacterium]|nr:chloride channel protein [Candidatus Sulfomarinibacter sp. MAG AM1]
MSSITRAWIRGFTRFSNRVDLYNFGRWLVLALLVGVVAGLGGALLTWGVDWISSVVLHDVVGFQVPGHGEAADAGWAFPDRPWFLLLVLPLVGLVVGWLVQTFAPEAEGHGTDAVINAYHRERAELRKRVVPVKLITSMLTIGSGGSAGREGPVAQVGAGFGSYLADLLRLGYHDRRVLVISGMAAGIGGMFRAPLGAALFAVEVLYSDPDFESEALIPAIISSIVSYIVVASLTGWNSIFHTADIHFARPHELVAYLVLGMVVAVVGVIYVKVFYGMRDNVFARMPIPNWTKPAVGGLLLAILALAVPQVLGGGYGWLQLTLDNQLPLKILILLLPAKILATSLTISSGGSGGVFAPSLVIGGVTGAIFADLVGRIAPQLAPPTAACVLVGMGGFFAGVAKVPIASLIMVAEMSGSYGLLVPMMLVSSVAYLLTRGVSIYEAQVPGRVDSPAHIGEFQIDVLERLTVRQVMEPDQKVVSVHPGASFDAVLEIVGDADQEAFPVVDEHGIVEGMFSINDVRRVMATPEVWPLLVASDLGVTAHGMAYLEPDDDLHTALQRFTAFKREILPVVDGQPPAPVIGVLRHHQVMEAYDSEINRLREEQAD